MSHKLQLAYYLLWIAHPVLQLAVATAMWRRKLHRTFPIFFAYVLSQIAIFAILFPTYWLGSYAHFFYAYWACAVITLALGFKVIHEIFLDVFRPFRTLKDLGSVAFKWAGLVMLLVAGVVAAASPAADQGPLVQAVLILQRCVRVIQCGLVLFLLVFSGYLGISWRQHSFGITLGFGSFAGAELILVALRSANYMSETAISLMNMVAYNCAILVWFSYVLSKSPARDASANLFASQRWDQSLFELHQPAEADSLIPMFEGMVDRALSRTTSKSLSVPEGLPTAHAAVNTAAPNASDHRALARPHFASKT